jgi:hypothetical protein
MFRSTGYLATPIAIIAAFFLSVGSAPLDTSYYSNKSAISSYTFNTGSGGVELAGNNLFLNHATKELLDVDKNESTNNSSGYKMDISAFSDAFLIVAWDSDEVPEISASKYVSLSTDGKNYNTYTIDDIFKHKNTSIGILKLDGYRFSKSDVFYVSLPMLGDTRNLDRISRAGWWVLGAKPSAGNRTTYSIDFNSSAKSIFELGLSDMGNLAGRDSKKIPNKGFTSLLDSEIGNSVSGEHYFSAEGAEHSGTPLLFVSESITTEIVPSASLRLEEDANSAGYHTVFMDIEIPSDFREDKVLIKITKPNFYVENSMSVPFGRELSGPLTDKSGDDIFEYDSETGSMIWRLNVGLEQLNRVSKTQFRFLAKEVTDVDMLRATIEIPSIGLKEFSNTIPIPKNRIDDMSIYSTYTPYSATRGKIDIFAYSDLISSAARELPATIEIRLVSHIALPSATLRNSNCSIANNEKLVCKVDFENGIASVSLDVLAMLDIYAYGVGVVEIVNLDNDPNLSNNKSEIVVVK